MRILQKTISIFLAAQLLVSFGLCGGLCCVKAVELSAPQAIEQTAEQDENLPPCHRKKAADKAALQQSHPTYKTSSAHSEHKSFINSSKTMLNRDCCAIEHEMPNGEPPAGIAATQSEKLVATLKTSPWSDCQTASGLPRVPIQLSATHSPPHTGFQLSLRI